MIFFFSLLILARFVNSSFFSRIILVHQLKANTYAHTHTHIMVDLFSNQCQQVGQETSMVRCVDYHDHYHRTGVEFLTNFWHLVPVTQKLFRFSSIRSINWHQRNRSSFSSYPNRSSLLIVMLTNIHLLVFLCVSTLMRIAYRCN